MTDFEAYPAFVDEVHHGNKRTPRAEVMWGPAGHSYVYVVYGKWHQFACVVAKPDVPDVVFIRAVWPIEGIEIATAQWEGAVDPHKVTDSPGKLCKSFQISRDHYGSDLCAGDLFIEDWGIQISSAKVKTAKRVGINSKHRGHDSEYRYSINRRDIANMAVASGSTAR